MIMMRCWYSTTTTLWVWLLLLALLCGSRNGWTAQGFSRTPSTPTTPTTARLHIIRQPTYATPNQRGGGGYDETDGVSKGLVSWLTNLVNRLVPSTSNISSQGNAIKSSNKVQEQQQNLELLPTSPENVMERIRADYVERNYLWTGDLDMACFTKDCLFQDPTIAFEGRDIFIRNVQNLRKVTDPILGPCRSELRDIALVHTNDNINEKTIDDNVASTATASLSSPTSSYVETKWRMVGLFSKLPWQPCIDVPGRTKFWMRPTTTTTTADVNGDSGIAASYTTTTWQVYKYEEEWEIPAAQALWQIVQPNGKYPPAAAAAQKQEGGQP